MLHTVKSALMTVDLSLYKGKGKVVAVLQQIITP
jgi:hypothetical protein